MERTLFGFIWRHSKRQQLVILGLTLLSFPILYMTLELPKWIVNDAISGTDFPRGFFGLELEQVPYLIALCCVFLGLVVLNNVVKYVMNIYKGVAGERMLRRLRYMLYDYVLRFPLQRFRRVSGGEIIPMITAEVEDVGVFIGEAIATPAFQGGTLLVYVVFIFAQDPFLGAAAISLYPLQAYVIPKLQKRVIMLTRDRIKNIRVISDRIGETVSAAPDIHANDTARYHLADLSDRLFVNYRIRLEIFRRKFMIKFLNNFLNQLPPFFFYSVGGYLVINGSLSFGALVAVLAAYKDLASPWKELLNWYQNLANVNVKYETVVENFDVEDAHPIHQVSGDHGGAVEELPNREIKLQTVSATTGGSGLDVEDVTMEVEEGSHLAVYGRDGSGRSELLMVMAGLIHPVAGRTTLGGRRFEDLSRAAIAANISYVGSDPYIFNETIRGNVVYGLKTVPQEEGKDEHADLRRIEAEITGNSLLDITARWEDFARAGVEDAAALDEKLLELFEVVGLGSDLYRLGLASHLGSDHETFVDKILATRAEVARRVAEDDSWADLVELWTPDTFNMSATIGENTLYALPCDPSRKVWEAVSDSAVSSALKEAGVLDLLVEMGADVAGTMIELFSDTGADASLIGDYSFVSTDDIPLFEARLKTIRAKGISGLEQADAEAFAALAFRLIPGRHRIVTITDEIAERLIAARKTVHARLEGTSGYALFSSDAYVWPLTIEENILFGKPRVDRRNAREKIDTFLQGTVRELGLRDAIARAGLNFSVGVAGGRLSSSQRRRIGLVRALIKRPQVLAFDAIADGDAKMMERVAALCADSTLIVGTADPQIARALPIVAVMREGQLAATGSWDSVSAIAVDGAPSEMEREAS